MHRMSGMAGHASDEWDGKSAGPCLAPDGAPGASCCRWSFGILMYELVYGFTPFRGAKRDQTFENILKRPLVFPPKPEISKSCQVRGLELATLSWHATAVLLPPCVSWQQQTLSAASSCQRQHGGRTPCSAETWSLALLALPHTRRTLRYRWPSIRMSFAASCGAGADIGAARAGPGAAAGRGRRRGGDQAPRLLCRHQLAAHPQHQAALRAPARRRPAAEEPRLCRVLSGRGEPAGALHAICGGLRGGNAHASCASAPCSRAASEAAGGSRLAAAGRNGDQ